MIDEVKLVEAIAVSDLEYLNDFISTYGVNYQIQSQDCDSLLSFALSDDKSNAYKFILKRSPDLSLVNIEGENVLHSIVYSGIAERLQGIMKSDGVININHQANDGTTPLLLSAILNKENVFLKLIELGANIHIPDEKLFQPIHAAAIVGNLAMTKKLIELGADLFSKTLVGNNPLAMAANNLHPEVIKYLCMTMYP